MKYPWANVLLLLLGALELITGFLGLLWGSPDRAIALQVHRVVGFAIVALLFWKFRNIVPPVLRPRLWKRFFVPYAAFLLFFGILMMVLALGLAWSHTGRFYFLGFSGVSWHINLSMLFIPFILWHTLFHRWNLRPRFWAERRSFVRFTGLLAAGFFLWRGGESFTALFELAGANRRFTGSYEVDSFSGNAFPVTSWLNDNPSPVKAENWRLRVTGKVEHEMALTYEALTKTQVKQTGTLDCTGGWHSTQEWEGVPVKAILERAGAKDGAASVTVRSVTGYYRRFSLKEAQGYIMATKVGGEVLSHSHGFPMRLVAPGKRRYDWVKWVTAIEVNDTSKWLQPPLPLQ